MRHNPVYFGIYGACYGENASHPLVTLFNFCQISLNQYQSATLVAVVNV